MSPPSETITIRTEPTLPGPPSKPSLGGKAGPCGCSLEWGAAAAYGSAITSYELEMKSMGNKGVSSTPITVYSGVDRRALVGTLGEERVTSAFILKPVSTYQFRVRAVNGLGPSEFSASLELSTASDRPDAPLPPALTSRGEEELMLSWLPPKHTHGAEVPAPESWPDCHSNLEILI